MDTEGTDSMHNRFLSGIGGPRAEWIGRTVVRDFAVARSGNAHPCTRNDPVSCSANDPGVSRGMHRSGPGLESHA